MILSQAQINAIKWVGDGLPLNHDPFTVATLSALEDKGILKHNSNPAGWSLTKLGADILSKLDSSETIVTTITTYKVNVQK